MKWIYLLGILLQYCVMLNANQPDCLVYDILNQFKKEFWSGEEITFYAFVLEDEVVNIKITYEGLDTSEFFTNLYFSPTTKLSRRIETKDGEDQIPNNLTTMEKSNDWVEFKIWSQKGSIRVSCEPNIHEVIPISQTSHTFRDLTMYASNRTHCNDERKWKIFEGNNVTIPFGKYTFPRSFLLKIDPSNDIRLLITRHDYTESVFSNYYNLTIERNKVTFQPLKIFGENMRYNTSLNEVTTLYIFSITGNMTTLNVYSKSRNTTFSVFFKTKPPFSPSTTLLPTIHGEACPSCNETPYVYLIPPLVIFIICTIIVGLGFRSEAFRSRVKKMKTSKCNGKPEKSSWDDEQSRSFTRFENNLRVEETVDL